MNFDQAKKIIAKKHDLGTTLVTGHMSKYWQEAAELYARRKWEAAIELAEENVFSTIDESRSRISQLKQEFEP